MAPLFGSDDCAVLDQGTVARTGIEPEVLYAIKWGRNGMLRKLKVEARQLWLISVEDQNNPERWVAVSLAGVDLLQIVRARATLLTPELESAALIRQDAANLVNHPRKIRFPDH